MVEPFFSNKIKFEQFSSWNIRLIESRLSINDAILSQIYQNFTSFTSNFDILNCFCKLANKETITPVKNIRFIMQLSLLSVLPELEKKVFLDVFAKAFHDPKRGKRRLKTIDGQLIPSELVVGCSTKILSQFPEGTIYKLDARLIQKQGKKPYFISIKKEKIMRALEFYEHNLHVQTGVEIKKKKAVVIKLKK